MRKQRNMFQMKRKKKISHQKIYLNEIETSDKELKVMVIKVSMK